MALITGVGMAAALFVGCGGGEETASAPAAASKPAASAPAKPGEYRVTTVTDGGSLAGTITFAGEAPAQKKLEVTKDLKVCGKEDLFSEELVVGASGALANVVVQIEGIAAGKAWEAAPLDQINCRFEPHIQVVSPTDKKLTVLNSDNILHNFHTWPEKNTAVNKAQPGYQKEMEITFETAEIVRASCDVHSWMQSYVVVPENPYVAVSGADGTFSIGDVPAGTYKVTMWHESLGTHTHDVTIEAGGSATLDMSWPAQG